MHLNVIMNFTNFPSWLKAALCSNLKLELCSREQQKDHNLIYACVETSKAILLFSLLASVHITKNTTVKNINLYNAACMLS